MRLKLIALISLFFVSTFGTLTSQASEELPFWTTPVKLEGMSAVRVSAVWYKNELHLVHGGKNSDAIWHAKWDGQKWSTANKVSSLPGGSSGAPALAVFQDTLHMVYKGDNNTLWHATYQGKGWTSLGRIGGQKSHYSPSMVVYPYDITTGLAAERLWMFHSGGSNDTKAYLWNSFFNGTSWSDDQESIGLSHSTSNSCMHDGILYQSKVYESGITFNAFVNRVGWRQASDVPQLSRQARSTTPVSLVSDGHNLYAFFRNSRSESSKEEPIYASVLTGSKWETPFPVKDFVTSESPAVVTVPGKKAQFYLLFTRNKDIYFTTNQPQLKPLKPLIQKRN
ncbi:MAG: hypothetical protein IPQ16_11115 [Geobacteraceae bacterium]|nr:hypothetical protein [Geobacteraceae bacterium]